MKLYERVRSILKSTSYMLLFLLLLVRCLCPVAFLKRKIRSNEHIFILNFDSFAMRIVHFSYNLLLLSNNETIEFKKQLKLLRMWLTYPKASINVNINSSKWVSIRAYYFSTEATNKRQRNNAVHSINDNNHIIHLSPLIVTKDFRKQNNQFE